MSTQDSEAKREIRHSGIHQALVELEYSVRSLEQLKADIQNGISEYDKEPQSVVGLVSLAEFLDSTPDRIKGVTSSINSLVEDMRSMLL